MENYTDVGTTKNGLRVCVDLQHSHAATHLLDTPHLLELVKECLATITAEDDNIYTATNLGRNIGTSDLVETSENDKIMYAKRLNRDNYTRFVLGRQAVATSLVTVVLHKKSAVYELWSAWIGAAAPQFPGSSNETPDSRSFWRTHALVWGNQAIQPGTETSQWPWGD